MKLERAFKMTNNSLLKILAVNTIKPREEENIRLRTFQKTAKLLGTQFQFATFKEYALNQGDFSNTDIVLPYLFVLLQEEYAKIEELAQQNNTLCFDSLKNVSSINSLKNSYPKLKEAGVQTPKTALVSFPELIKEYAEQQDIMSFTLGLEQVLKAILKEEDMVPSNDKKVFVKTFSRSHKENVNRNIAKSINGIIAHAYQLLQLTDMGTDGLAIREALDLDRAFNAKSDGKEPRPVFREYRFYAIGGIPICWSFCAMPLTASQTTIDRCRPRDEELQKMVEIVNKVAAVMPSHFYTVDCAVCKNKDIVVIETNGGYSSGAKEETSPAVQAALLSYLNLVKQNPQMFLEKPDKKFREHLDFEKWEQIRSNVAGEKKYWGTLSNWIKQA